MRVKPASREKSFEVKKSLMLKYIDAIDKKKITKERTEKLAKPGITWAFWKRHTLEFCKTTGLHGYKFVAMEELPVWERISWAIAVITCLILSIFFIKATWEWNSDNSTIEIIESTHYPTWQFPYPAVTICNINKASKYRSEDFLKNGLVDRLNMTDEEILFGIRNIVLLFGRKLVDPETSKKMERFQILLDKNNINITTFIDNLNPTCTDIFIKCIWQETPINCNELFSFSYTVEGVCCSYNYLGKLVGKMINKKSDRDIKVAGCGVKSGLSAVLKIDTDDYYSTLFGTYGVRIYIHSSYDYPDENASTKLIGRNTEIFVALSPEMTYTTTEMKKYSPDKRDCLVPSEGKSSYFTQYSYYNCIAECRSNDIFNVCSCVPFYLPNTGGKRVCNFGDVQCIYENRGVLTTSYIRKNNTCKCLPDCDQISYPIELSSGKLATLTPFDSDSFYKDMDMNNVTLLHIYYNDLLGTLYRRDVYMSWQNLLASIGGLLGLFVGFSFVSLFELVYFFTVRLFFDFLQTQMPKSSKGPPKAVLKKDVDEVEWWTDKNGKSFNNYEVSIISKNDDDAGVFNKKRNSLTKLSE